MTNFKIYNATDLWQKETNVPSVPTFCQNLDNILGSDGLQLGTITELIGLPGSGKTQLCLQLCASVQISKQLGGLDAEALYIDTNTNFTLSRFREILSASLMKCQKLLNAPQTTEDEALKRLHYVNAFGLETYCSLMQQLPKFIEDHPNIKLIAIDSIAYPFKGGGVSLKQRTGILFRQMADLQRVAIQNQIAVVLTNEMSTRVGLSGGSVVGALGDAWAHRCNVRLLLSTPHTVEDSNHRLALLMKSNIASVAVARFQISSDGIRDVESNTGQHT